MNKRTYDVEKSGGFAQSGSIKSVLRTSTIDQILSNYMKRCVFHGHNCIEEHQPRPPSRNTCTDGVVIEIIWWEVGVRSTVNVTVISCRDSISRK